MILKDIFESKMSELDIEYQDFLNSRGRNSMSDDEFEQAYGMTRTEWAKRNKEWTWQKERRPVAPDAHLFHENSEYDDEAGMAHTNLHTTARAVEGLINTIKDQDNLPEWVQEKIAKAEGMLVNVWDYLLSQKEQGIDPQVDEDWQKVNKKDRTAGMSKKAVKAYRREHPGSKLQTAVTTKPSKLKKGSKAAKRRSSYCSRSKGQMKMHNISCQKTPDKAICAARRRWNCEESIEEGSQTFGKHDPYWVCVNGKKWKRFETYEHARAVHDKLEKKLRSEGSDKKVSLLAADDVKEGLRDPKDNPCWKGYKPVGTKEKGGRTVPNCVPKE